MSKADGMGPDQTSINWREILLRLTLWGPIPATQWHNPLLNDFCRVFPHIPSDQVIPNFCFVPLKKLTFYFHIFSLLPHPYLLLIQMKIQLYNLAEDFLTKKQDSIVTEVQGDSACGFPHP